MNHRTVKTPESAVTSLARPNGSLVPPRPSAHVPLGPALPRPTAGGRLRLARRLGSASLDPPGDDSASPNGWRATPPRQTVGSTSPDPQGMHTASLNPRGLGSAPFDGRGTTPLRPMAGGRLRLGRWLGSASPDH